MAGMLAQMTLALAAEPLATFSARDVIGIAWPRTLLTHSVSFKPGEATRDNLSRNDAVGSGHRLGVCWVL
jgi:hypothetical protein